MTSGIVLSSDGHFFLSSSSWPVGGYFQQIIFSIDEVEMKKMELWGIQYVS